MIKIIIRVILPMLLKKQPFKLWGTWCEAYSFTLGSPGCISVSGLGGKHSRGKKVEAETSALCFPDSWSLASPKSTVRVLFKKKNFFLNVAWQSCRSVLCLEPVLDTSIDRSTLDWPCREMRCVACLHLGSFSLAPIFPWHFDPFSFSTPNLSLNILCQLAHFY